MHSLLYLWKLFCFVILFLKKNILAKLFFLPYLFFSSVPIRVFASVIHIFLQEEISLIFEYMLHSSKAYKHLQHMQIRRHSIRQMCNGLISFTLSLVFSILLFLDLA